MPTDPPVRAPDAMAKGGWAAAFLVAASCLLSIRLGQDNNFDLHAYHVYNAWAFLGGRWSRDLFAAGPPTFFSPYLDLPYYVAARQLLPSHGALLAALAGLPYAALLFFAYRIADRIARALELAARDRIVFVGACVLVSATGAATWSEIGTTFNDIPVAAIVLAAFHTLLPAPEDGDAGPSTRRVAVAGMLVGLAMGLKLTAAMYAPSMAVAILALTRGWRDRVRALAVYGGCAFAVLVAVYGPWGWRLHELTGNPFFPLLNGVFRSDWMASVNARDARFLPKSWPQWLFYPFHWTRLQSSLVTELPFRDLRFAVAYVFLAGYGAMVLASRDARSRLLSRRYKALHALVLLLVVSYILWLVEFSILRYLVAAECLASIFIVAATMAIARRLAHTAAWAPALCVIAVAGLVVGHGVAPRWGRVPVGTDLLAVQAPRFEPGALLVFGDNAMSFLAPGLAAANPGVHFMSVPRWFAPRPGVERPWYELERRMAARIAGNAKSFYVLFHESQRPPTASLAQFDVELDMASCRPGRSPAGLQFVACRGIHPAARPAPSAPR